MSIYAPRPISDDEFTVHFNDLVGRLDAHLELISRGDFKFRNDLAAVVRILLGRDRANQAVRRFSTRFELPEPTVAVAGSAKEAKDTLLHLGALPTSEEDEQTRRLRISTELLQEVALFVRGGEAAWKFTWQAVIDDYGNSFGAHLTQTVPRILDATRFYGVGPTDIGTYMLWAIGVASSNAAHELLAALDPNHVPTEHPRYLAGTEITEILYLRKDGKDDLRARIRRESWQTPGPIVAVPNPDGDHLLFSVELGGKLSLTVIEEAAGP